MLEGNESGKRSEKLLREERDEEVLNLRDSLCTKKGASGAFFVDSKFLFCENDRSDHTSAVNVHSAEISTCR